MLNRKCFLCRGILPDYNYNTTSLKQIPVRLVFTKDKDGNPKASGVFCRACGDKIQADKKLTKHMKEVVILDYNAKKTSQEIKDLARQLRK